MSLITRIEQISTEVAKDAADVVKNEVMAEINAIKQDIADFKSNAKGGVTTTAVSPSVVTENHNPNAVGKETN